MPFSPLPPDNRASGDSGHVEDHDLLRDWAVSAESEINSRATTTDITTAVNNHHAPNSTDHDDRYYTETEVDGLLATKSATGHTHSGTYLTLEEAQDAINTMIVAGTNVTKTYDDNAGTLTINATAGSGSMTREEVEDLLASSFAGTSPITVTYSDVGNSFTVSASVGTTAGTLAAGDHNHTGVYATSGHNHSGVYDPAGTASSAVTAHEADTTNVHGIADTSALATTTALNTHINNGTDAHDASAISVVTAGFGGNLTAGATTVQSALDEIDNLSLGGAATYPTERVDVSNPAYAGGAKGDAVELRGTVSGSTLTITSGSIPSTFTGTNVYTAVIEATDGGVPLVTKFTRTSGSTATLQNTSARATAVTVFLGTDDTAAIIAARDAWIASLKATATDGYYFTKYLYFPFGSYICTQQDALMHSDDRDFNHVTRGGLIQGSEKTACRIVFASSTGTTNDRGQGNLLSFYVRSMQFRAANFTAYSANKNQTFAWMWDTTNSGQAHFTWDSIELAGKWKSGWALDGDNNANMNSECSFERCSTRYTTSFERALFESGGVTDTVLGTVSGASNGLASSQSIVGTSSLKAITNITGSAPGTRTATVTAHGFSVGHYIAITGTSGGALDEAVTVATVPDADTFTYTSAKTGTYTASTVDYAVRALSVPVADASTFDDQGQGYVYLSTGPRSFKWLGKSGNTLLGCWGGNYTIETGATLVAAYDQQEQFLDYNFISCDFIYKYGDTIRLTKGGHVNVYGGGWIVGVNETESGDAGDFFSMPYATHFDDVMHLNVHGTRFEKRTRGTHLLNTYWYNRNAHIKFDGCAVSDNSVGAGSSAIREESRLIAINANQDGGGNYMPNVKFDNCQLPGYAEYTSTIGAATRGMIAFERCNFRNWATAAPGNAGDTFLRWTGSNTPRYRMHDCDGVTNIANPADATGGAPTGSAGGSLAGSYPNPTIAAGAIGAAEIAANAVGTSELADSAVDTAAIQDAAVTYGKIQDVSATSRVLGRITAGAGDVEELTAANLTTIAGGTSSTTLAVGDHTHAASAVTVSAAGFDGNLTTGDTTVQAVAQKVDDLRIWGNRVTALTDAATITSNCDTTDIATLTITATGRTLGAPSGTPVNGQRLQYRIRQDATGGRTITTYNAAFRFSTDVAQPTLSTAANKTDYLLFQWNSTDSKWDCISVVKGY